MVILLANSSCKENDSEKVNDEKSYYEFTVQSGALSGKTYKVWEFAPSSTGNRFQDEEVLASEITFFENRVFEGVSVQTYFKILWNGNTPYPLGSDYVSNDKGLIKLTAQEGDQTYVFTSENATFTVTDRETIRLEDKIMKTTYPAYELEGNFQGTFMAEPGNETVSISGKLKLVNVII